MNAPLDRKLTLDYVISFVLRIGLFLSIATVAYGGAVLLWNHSGEVIDYHLFDSEPASLRDFSHIFNDTAADPTLVIIQLGIILLISTPIIRVLSCLVLFAVERDLLYVILSAFVLGALLYANY